MNIIYVIKKKGERKTSIETVKKKMIEKEVAKQFKEDIKNIEALEKELKIAEKELKVP